MKPHRLLLALPLCLALSAHADEQAAPAAAAAAAPTPEKPLALVNGVAIPAIYADFLRRERAARDQSPELMGDAAIREGLIAAEVMAQEALKKGLDKNPSLIALMEYQRKEILGRALLEDYLRSNPISEETLKSEYDKAKARAGESEYRVSHILVPSEKEAREIIAKLKAKKAKFEELAKKQSKDASAGNGGDLGWISPAGLVPEFAEAMVKLKKGEYTQAPVQTRFGWHVIRLEDSRTLEFPPYEQVKARIAQQLQQIAVRNYVRGLRNAAKVE